MSRCAKRAPQKGARSGRSAKTSTAEKVHPLPPSAMREVRHAAGLALDTGVTVVVARLSLVVIPDHLYNAGLANDPTLSVARMTLHRDDGRCVFVLTMVEAGLS